MRAKKSSQTSTGKPRNPAGGGPNDGATSQAIGRHPATLSGADPATNIDSEQVERGGNWWQRFRAEFSSSHPEKQLSQVYYITAILTVIGSLIAGLWAFGEGIWSEKLAVAPSPSVMTPDTTAANQPAPATTLSIVVLPFVNLSGDPAQEYFADGITDTLTTDLSRAVPGSFVVSRETAFTYKGKAIDARQIGRELRVRYALEGSALQDGDQIRINARLVDTQGGNEVWAERFDTARSEVLRVQDEIVGRLSRAIGLQVINLEARRKERETSGTVQSIDLVLRGQAELNRPSSQATMIAARDLFQQALKLQPDNVDALAGVATTYVFEVLNGYYDTDNDLRLQQAEPLLSRALALDDRHLGALKARAGLLRAQGKFADALTAAQLVIAQNPGEPWAYKEVGLSTMYLGRTADALDWFKKAEEFGPRDPGRWTWLAAKGQALLLLARDEEAIASLRSAIDANPSAIGEYAVLAAAYALSGRSDEARTTLARYQELHPSVTVATFRNLSPVPLQLTDPNYRQQRERLKEGLRKAGMPD
jgi:TolB-like protein/tetratricopeptide (TPR) repeat protein